MAEVTDAVTVGAAGRDGGAFASEKKSMTKTCVALTPGVLVPKSAVWKLHWWVRPLESLSCDVALPVSVKTIVVGPERTMVLSMPVGTPAMAQELAAVWAKVLPDTVRVTPPSTEPLPSAVSA